MPKFYYLILLLLCVQVWGQGYKKIVAVDEFKVSGVSKQEASMLAGQIASSLSKRKDKFTVMNSADIERILKEQEYQKTGCTDSSCAVEIGKLLNAQYIVIGELTKLSDGNYYLKVSMVDVETANIASAPDLITTLTFKEMLSKTDMLAGELAGEKSTRGNSSASLNLSGGSLDSLDSLEGVSAEDKYTKMLREKYNSAKMLVQSEYFDEAITAFNTLLSEINSSRYSSSKTVVSLKAEIAKAKEDAVLSKRAYIYKLAEKEITRGKALFSGGNYEQTKESYLKALNILQNSEFKSSADFSSKITEIKNEIEKIELHFVGIINEKVIGIVKNEGDSAYSSEKFSQAQEAYKRAIAIIDSSEYKNRDELVSLKKQIEVRIEKAGKAEYDAFLVSFDALYLDYKTAFDSGDKTKTQEKINAITSFLSTHSKYKNDDYVLKKIPSLESTPKEFFDYKSDNGKIIITKYKGKDNSVIIPHFIDGLPVTTIGSGAFYDCDSLESVTIPNSVTTIDARAFEECDSLTSITIGNSVTTIGNYAFANCKSLTSITIGNSVTTIGEGAFAFCDRLKSITIPDSVTTIGEYAFYECDSLESITIPNSVPTIGERAFAYCHSLTSITIGNSVTTIGEREFAWCDSLTSITIGNSVPTIGVGAFAWCRSLESVTIPNSVTTIGEEAFKNCDSLESITIPDSVTTIGEYAFGGCDSLESITIPNSVTTIGEYAFYNNVSLTNITIGNSVTTIGEYAFAYCDSLTSVTIKAKTPPAYGEGRLFYGTPDEMKIYVPAGSVSAYKNAYGWSGYAGKIRAIE